MNTQIERLENHTARFTVTLDKERLDKAKQDAGRRIARKVNIPGFRKGKAPYKILLQYVGEPAILEEAIELLGNDLYKSALDESKLEPYGPGQLEDFQLDPEPTFKFVVPLQPTTDLGDYRSVRMDYTAPEVEDDQVNRAMRQLQEQHAVIEESQQPVAQGNRVTMELYGKLIEEGKTEGGSEKAEEAASEEVHDHAHDEAHSHDHDHEHGHEHSHDHGLGGEEFIHEHNAVMILGEDNEEPAPGFKQALMGATVGEERVFELDYPDDSKEYEEYAGKRAQFKAKINKVENVTMPALNEEFATRVTEKEEKQLSLLELRMRMRENLQKALEEQSKSRFAAEALDKLVEKATISFPEEMINDQSEDYLERMDNDLRRQGLTLDDYIRITGKNRDAIKADYRDVSIQNIKRSLVLRELNQVENIDVPESKIDAEIDRMLVSFGDQGASLRSALDTPQMRSNIKNDLLQQSVLDRIVAIVKGEETAAPAASEEATDATASQQTTEGESAQ